MYKRSRENEAGVHIWSRCSLGVQHSYTFAIDRMEGIEGKSKGKSGNRFKVTGGPVHYLKHWRTWPWMTLTVSLGKCQNATAMRT